MRAIAVILWSCWLLPAHAGAPDPALLEAEALIQQVRRAEEGEGPPGEPPRPADIERVLRALLARCLAGTEECKELDWLDTSGPQDVRQVARSADVLIGLLGQRGSADVIPLLWQLEARGSYSSAGSAREAIQTRLMTQVLATRPCEPPSSEEVAKELARLGDFAALRVRGGRLVAVRPSPQELEDLAYFLVAVRDAGPPVGEAQESGGDWRRPAPSNDSLDAAYEELTEARLRGDLQGMDAAARRYLVLLGYPGPLKAREENAYGWHGSRYSSVLREWARVQEDLGAFGEAAGLFRRANPGDGACGTGVDSVLEEQLRAVIRTTERHSGCNGVVAERLLDIDGAFRGEDDPSPYGPARLRKAGFDVARLYRGALVTRHRDIPLEELKRVLSSAREPLRTAALRRYQERGPEAWEQRVMAIEGFADVAQRDALEPLIALAVDSLGETQRRAVIALSDLAERPRGDPCTGDGGMGSRIRPGINRYIHKLGEHCATTLKPQERDAMVARLLPILESKDGRTREVTAEALGLLGSELAIPRLRQLATDTYTQGYYLSENGTRKTSHYPVREAAAEALKRFK